MKLHLAFLVIDCLAIFSILLLGAGILRSAPQSMGARLFALLALNSACYQIWSRAVYSGWIPAELQFDIGILYRPMQILMMSTPGVFMILCFVLFQEGPRFPRWLAALFATQLGLAIFSLALTGDPTPTVAWLRELPALMQLGFVAMGIVWIVKDWRVDLVETRRGLRLIFLLVFGVMTFGLTLLEGLVISSNSIAQFYVHEGAAALSVLLNAAFVVMLFNTQWIRPDDLIRRRQIAPVAEVAAQVSDGVSERDFKDLNKALGAGVYREPGLTIASLALKLSVPEHRLRRLINVRLGFRNFNAMLNHYRIEAAAAALCDPGQRHTPILTIALTAGFQSINPFNRAFRELKGMTPSDFRQQQHTET